MEIYLTDPAYIRSIYELPHFVEDTKDHSSQHPFSGTDLLSTFLGCEVCFTSNKNLYGNKDRYGERISSGRSGLDEQRPIHHEGDKRRYLRN